MVGGEYPALFGLVARQNRARLGRPVEIVVDTTSVCGTDTIGQEGLLLRPLLLHHRDRRSDVARQGSELFLNPPRHPDSWIFPAQAHWDGA